MSMTTTKYRYRNYRDLIRLKSFEERFEYLKLSGEVGKDTFGFDRIFNQMFYESTEWKQLRDFVITRDYGRDLGIKGREIKGSIYIHHMNPICLDDIKNSTEFLLNPDFLVCCSFNTHQAIHYGDQSNIVKDPVERKSGDTCPWRNNNG